MQGVLRAPAEGEGGVAHREDLAATASATARSSGAPVRWLMARGRRASGVAAAPRSRAAGAPATRAAGAPCGRRVRVPRAFKRPAKTFGGGGGGGAHTNSENYLRQASPDRGKYIIVE